jgi:hypothetical protein
LDLDGARIPAQATDKNSKLRLKLSIGTFMTVSFSFPAISREQGAGHRLTLIPGDWLPGR